MIKMHSSEDTRHKVLNRQPMVKNKPKLSPKHRRARSLDYASGTSDHHREERKKVVEKWKKVVSASREASIAADDGYEAESSDEESFEDEFFHNNEVRDLDEAIPDDDPIRVSSWVLHPKELQTKLERVKSERDWASSQNGMPDSEETGVFYARYMSSGDHCGNEYNDDVMGDGRRSRSDGNRHTSHGVKTDDQNIADAKMTSITTIHTMGNDKPCKMRTKTNGSLSRDNMRLSYRLAKGNLHPHFDSPTEEDVEFGFGERFENDDSSGHYGHGFSRRRKSMTLAMIEGELLDVSGDESGTQTPIKLFLRRSSNSSDNEQKSETQITDDYVFLDAPNSSKEKRSMTDVSATSLPNRHDRESRRVHRGGSFNPESLTSKSPPTVRRAMSLKSDKDKDGRLTPIQFMSKLKQNFSFRSKTKEKKSTPVISAPLIQRVPSDTYPSTTEQTVQMRSHGNTVAGNRDPSNRLTWHGSTGTVNGAQQDRPTRSRKVGVSPIENARYSTELQTSKSTMNVSEYGSRQIRSVRDFYEEDSDGNSSCAFASPTSSLCSSNPNSRPCSTSDLNWEDKYNVLPNDIRRAESEGSVSIVSRSGHSSRRHSRCGSGRNTPVGSPPTNGILYRSKSSPGTPSSLQRHVSSLETIQQNSSDAIDIPTDTSFENNTRTSRRRSSGDDSSSSSIGRRSQKVTFEEDERRKLLENASRTPKPRHQPRRVKTDLGDTRNISIALYQSNAQDMDETPRPVRRKPRRRAMSELGTSTHVKEAIEKLKERKGTSVTEAFEKLKERKNDVDAPTEIMGANKPVEHSQPEILPQQHPAHHTDGHRQIDNKDSLSRSHSSQDVQQELKRSDSTDTLTRTPSVPSIVSMDLEDIHKEDIKSIDMIHDDRAPYLPANVNLQAYGLGPMAILAEALWDHVTMDVTELGFQAGDVIEVTDTTDKNWWWGYLGEDEGWIPTQFIRLRVSQGETVEECMERLNQEKKEVSTATHGRISMSFLSNDQVRANVVHEILTTERDYVKHLRDVCDGYLDQAQHRPEMFSEESIQTIFGNIAEIYSFHKNFSLMIEACIHPEYPHLSDIGKCFLNQKYGFHIYSDYCNNYPRAVGELKVLMDKPRYQHFFEACRLLQNMIEINLHGFLLTPIQKICKYPLQLGELLKYTRAQHSDYEPLREALRVMKDVAVGINERKRTVENIDKIAAWQKSILDWECEDILMRSTQLIHSGEVTKILTKGGRKRTVDRSLYLFDHQLIICKKDMLRRGYQYRRKLNMDRCRVNDLPDGRENTWNINIKNGWKVWDTETYKMYIFCVKTLGEKVKWLQAFEDEREIVEEDRVKGVHIPKATKEAAMKHSTLIDLPSKPNDLTVSRKISSMPYDYKHKPMEEPQTKVALPEGISSTDIFKERRRRSLFGFNKKQTENGDQ